MRYDFWCLVCQILAFGTPDDNALMVSNVCNRIWKDSFSQMETKTSPSTPQLPLRNKYRTPMTAINQLYNQQKGTMSIGPHLENEDLIPSLKVLTKELGDWLDNISSTYVNSLLAQLFAYKNWSYWVSSSLINPENEDRTPFLYWEFKSLWFNEEKDGTFHWTS